ncbi:hypothetical protein GN956_G1584 [Arapaima gigas]
MRSSHPARYTTSSSSVARCSDERSARLAARDALLLAHSYCTDVHFRSLSGVPAFPGAVPLCVARSILLSVGGAQHCMKV